MPGAHKIGAAISGPRIAGGNFMDITLFLTLVNIPLAQHIRHVCRRVSETQPRLFSKRKTAVHLHIFLSTLPSGVPKVVVLNAVGRRNTQTSAKERKRKGRKRAQKGASGSKLQTTRYETTRFGNSRFQFLWTVSVHRMINL